VQLQLWAPGLAAKPFLTDEARKVYWAQAWERTVVRAATRVESNRKEFHGLRLSAIPEVLLVTRRLPWAGPGRGGGQHLIG
jgi:hypothetical protein